MVSHTYGEQESARVARLAHAAVNTVGSCHVDGVGVGCDLSNEEADIKEKE